MTDYVFVGLTTAADSDWGNAEADALFCCQRCGAVVSNRIFHDEWHGDGWHKEDQG